MGINKAQCPLPMMQQIGVAGLLSAIVALFWGSTSHSWQISYSFLLGVFLWMLPSYYFANKLFSCLGKVSPASLLGIFYRAEIIKLLLSGFFFVMIIKLLTVNVPVLVIGYFVAQLVFWLGLIAKNKEALL
jgi:ATP synthase protein I